MKKTFRVVRVHSPTFANLKGKIESKAEFERARACTLVHSQILSKTKSKFQEVQDGSKTSKPKMKLSRKLSLYLQ